jgi:starvation-inducible DNA-binding protein
MNKLISSLLMAFANNFAFYLKSHQFHWAVMGENFPQYHELLEDIYTDAQEAIDDYAEELRRLGVFPKGDLKDIIADSQIADTPTDAMITDPQEMFLVLLGNLTTVITTLQDTFDEATSVREYGLQNFLADRISAHRKTQWKLTATVTPCVEYVAGNENYPSHTMINPETGAAAEIETEAQHMAAESAGYTEESAPYDTMNSTT